MQSTINHAETLNSVSYICLGLEIKVFSLKRF